MQRSKALLITLLMVVSTISLFSNIVTAGSAPSKPDVLPDGIDVINGHSQLFAFRALDSDSATIKLEITWISESPQPGRQIQTTGWIPQGNYIGITHTWAIDEDIIDPNGGVSYMCEVRAYDGESYGATKFFRVTVISPPPPPPPPQDTAPHAKIQDFYTDNLYFDIGETANLYVLVKNNGESDGYLDVDITCSNFVRHLSDQKYIKSGWSELFTFSVSLDLEEDYIFQCVAGSTAHDTATLTLTYGPQPPPPPPPNDNPDPPPPPPPTPEPKATITEFYSDSTYYEFCKPVNLHVKIKNTGDSSGTIQCRIVDQADGLAIATDSKYIPLNGIVTYSFSRACDHTGGWNLEASAGYEDYDDSSKTLNLGFNSPPPGPPSTITAEISVATGYSKVIAYGDSTRLYWKTTNAQYVFIEPAIGSVAGEGYLQVSPAQTTQYMLTASSAAGTAYDAVTITVTDAAPPSPPPEDGDGSDYGGGDGGGGVFIFPGDGGGTDAGDTQPPPSPPPEDGDGSGDGSGDDGGDGDGDGSGDGGLLDPTPVPTYIQVNQSYWFYFIVIGALIIILVIAIFYKGNSQPHVNNYHPYDNYERRYWR